MFLYNIFAVKQRNITSVNRVKNQDSDEKSRTIPFRVIF